MPSFNVMPEKRLFLSVISEYDLPRAICELVDNAVDFARKNSNSNLQIEITIDIARQTILIEDNAGGVSTVDLALLFSPGQTTNEVSDNGIGYFGVGAKRAVIALAQDVTIQTRFEKEATSRVHFDDDWINEIQEWELQYDIPPRNIKESTTLIELFKLRSPVTDQDVDTLRTHLGEVYALFIEGGVKILVNTRPISPILFNKDWTYAKEYKPTSFSHKLSIEDRHVDVTIESGLINHSGDPDNSYGVFIYCNNRLIVKGLTDFSVGFESGKVGNPHFNISLTRTIVKLNGQSRDMPWNSSKSGIDPKHPTFQRLRTSIITITADYAKISRTLQGQWDTEFFPYTEGSITRIQDVPIEHISKTHLPTPPSRKTRWAQRFIQANKKLISKKIWVEGLQDSLIAADYISRLHLTQKDRVALILLDSTLEIAFKEYLVNEKNIGMQKFQQVAQNRASIETEVYKSISVSATMKQQINHYYRLRNDLVHQRATPNVSEIDIDKYREIVEHMLKKMFHLKFKV